MARRSFRYNSFERFPLQPSSGEKVARASKAAAALANGGKKLSPVELTGSAIATTFWGKAWCRNLEGYSDYSNRLPRGRSYVRTGAVLDLAIEAGRVVAIVQGSRRYEVTIKIAPVAEPVWQGIVATSAGRVSSMIDLLRGALPESLLEAVTTPGKGLFPEPREIALACSCPDWATMCKHVAAVMYGVGARLDADPALLFTLRRADASVLVAGAVTRAVRASAPSREKRFEGDLAAVFGIDLATTAPPRQARDVERKVVVVPAAAAKTPRTTKTPKAKTPRMTKAPKPIRWTRRELASLGASTAVIDRWVRRGLLVPESALGPLVETPAFRAAIAPYADRAIRGLQGDGRRGG